jgi:hypothetical protein
MAASREVDLYENPSESDRLFDVMDNEEKTKADTFVKGYCLYKHMANRLVSVLRKKPNKFMSLRIYILLL